MKDGRYLGVDPGIKNFGYAVIEVKNDEISFVNCGRMPNLSNHYPTILNQIKEGMGSALRIHSVVEAGFEEVMFGRNRTAAMSTAKAIGAFQMACQELDIDCRGVSPSRLKKLISGNGRASKDEIKQSVFERLDTRLDEEIKAWDKSVPENDSSHPHWRKVQLENADDHTIDAVAVALWLTMEEF